MGFGKLLKNTLKGHWESTFGKGLGGTLNDITGATDMYEKEYEGNLKLWNLQNEYNTPAAQIARMAAAGIDVNPMTYAVGNGNMSTTAGNISAPSVGASGVNPVSTLIGMMEGIKDMQVAKQSIQNMKTQESYVRNKERNELDMTIENIVHQDLVNKALAHNITYAKTHNVPLNMMPGLDSAATSYFNEVLGTVHNDVAEAVGVTPAENYVNERVSREYEKRRYRNGGKVTVKK